MSELPKQEKEPEFDWLVLHDEIHAQHPDESTQDKFLRKVKENPFVPIGCLATFSALSYGLWSFRQGRRQMSQYMMRVRIAAQGFTVVALIVGIGISATRSTG
ncbi:HIG1 domain family member 2A, mitochondrial [Cryptotermes secundus]|uniref:HIG1 domain family member 2A, mitochondrial n=1 Tax=Cryptotermes secundus TaxID=105785 RepID=A0A2J7QCI7_9NEOP|nr:HIG1 domain family member 2A, mitochondrial [Cryptotermes secundus]